MRSTSVHQPSIVRRCCIAPTNPLKISNSFHTCGLFDHDTLSFRIRRQHRSYCQYHLSLCFLPSLVFTSISKSRWHRCRQQSQRYVCTTSVWAIRKAIASLMHARNGGELSTRKIIVYVPRCITYLWFSSSMVCVSTLIRYCLSIQKEKLNEKEGLATIWPGKPGPGLKMAFVGIRARS